MPGFRISLLALLLIAPVTVGAQVGHDPRTSPYRDIKHGSMLVPQAAFVQGSGGSLGIVPNSGVLYGFRAEIGGAGPLLFGLEFGTGTLQRLIVDADAPVATRVTGPVDQAFSMFGINLKLNLTGGKTWHGLAPYVGGGAGLAFAGKVPADTSGWNYSKRIYLAPTVGIRFFLRDNLYLRVEARSVFAKVTYPESYREEPALDPGTNENPNAVLAGQRVKQWVASGVYTIGLGFPFPWP
ncbi:MAG: hypothetical protein SGI84_14135 [Gemmatimonadota bacterium]|nr:hypothetical protein [Gemmatimonadota bacterium]